MHRLKLLLSAAGLDAGSAPPVAAHAPSTNPIALPQTPPGPLDPDYKAPTDQPWVPKHPWDTPPKDAPAPVDQAPPDQAPPPQNVQPTVLYSDDRGFAVQSQDGQFIEFYNPDATKLLTRVKNDPSAIATVIARDKGFIEQLRTTNNGPLAAPEPPPDPKAQMRETWRQRALQAAQAKYHAIDDKVDVSPLAEVLADLLTEYDSEKTETTQKASAAEQAFQSEVAWVQKMDPEFDFNHDLSMAIRQKYPHYGPQQVFKEAQFWIAQGQKQNGHQPAGQPNGQQPPVQQPSQPRLQVPAEMWGKPGGSTGQANPLASYENHPEVMAAVSEHGKYMRMLGKTATPESTAAAKQTAIDTVIERQTRQQKGQY